MFTYFAKHLATFENPAHYKLCTSTKKRQYIESAPKQSLCWPLKSVFFSKFQPPQWWSQCQTLHLSSVSCAITFTYHFTDAHQEKGLIYFPHEHFIIQCPRNCWTTTLEATNSWVSLTLSVHVQEGYSTHFVCQSFKSRSRRR